MPAASSGAITFVYLPLVARRESVPASAVLAALVLVFLAGCSGGAPPDAGFREVQPVTVLTLAERDFAREGRLTGSVKLYREEQVGFEVDGRVLAVMDVGKEVQGPAFNEVGEMIRQGDVIARLDPRRYELRVKALDARLQSLQKQLEAQRIEVDQVAKNEIEAARRAVESATADLTLARQNLDRQRVLIQTNATPQSAVERAEQGFDAATAGKLRADAVLASAAGRLALQEARVEATEAQIVELSMELEVAAEDLSDCQLYAPFSGRITYSHTTQGAVVEKGTSIVTLSLMDPIQVNVAVSANEDRKIETGDRVYVYPKDPIDPEGEPVAVPAIVYEKGAVADPATRTFQIDLMARNQRRLVHHAVPETAGLPVITDFLPVVREYQGEGGPLFVQTGCVYSDGGKTYVLRLPGVSFHSSGQMTAVGKHVPEKVEVTLGEEYFTVNKWNFRSLLDSGDLIEGDFLATGPTKAHEGGLAIGRPQWLLRPGDLVPVMFYLDQTPRGFYIPLDAIVKRAGSHSVFVARDGVARRVAVEVRDTFGELRRIEGEGIEGGTRIIVRGAHYVSDGQPISIAGEEDDTT